MNVGTIKTLAYLTSVGLLGGIGYLGYEFQTKGKNARYFDPERAREVLQGVVAPSAPVAVGLNYDRDIRPSIIGFDWTGAPPPIEPEPDEGPVGPVVVPDTPVDDILDVLAIIYSDDNPGDSHALLRITDAQPPNRDLWFYVGDSLPAPNEDIAVFDIRGDAVVFSFGKETRAKEEVSPAARKESGVIVHVTDPDAIVKRSRIEGSVVASPVGGDEGPTQTVRKNGQYYLGTEDAAQFGQNYDQILTRDVGTETYYDKDGKRAGIQVTSVKAGSIAARHGVQEGDIIISINGKKVSSKQEAIAFAKKNADRYDVWRVEVMNLGRVRTEVYHTPKD